MKDLVNSTPAEEVELNRPPNTIFERIFRLCLYYVVIVGLAISVLSLFLDRETIESDGGPVGAFFGILFVICFVYMLNYAVARFVRSKFIKITWWLLMTLVALLAALGMAGGLKN